LYESFVTGRLQLYRCFSTVSFLGQQYNFTNLWGSLRRKEEWLRIAEKNPGNTQVRIVNSGIASRNTGIIGKKIVNTGIGGEHVDDFRN